jgi:ARC6-like, IMS domain
MLKVWSERATEMVERGWHWKYELVNVSVDSLTVSLDGQHATVEATIEESARVFDGQTGDDGEFDNAYSTGYTARYEMAYTDSGWKIVDGAILESQ